MGEPEDYFIEKLCDALAACARARELVPSEWDAETQDDVRRQIAVAMGLLQPPGMAISVTKGRETLRWDTCLFDMDDDRTDSGRPINQEHRVRSVASRLTAYARLAQSILTRLEQLLQSYEARAYRAKLTPEEGANFLASSKTISTVLHALGDDGIYPWL